MSCRAADRRFSDRHSAHWRPDRRSCGADPAHRRAGRRLVARNLAHRRADRRFVGGQLAHRRPDDDLPVCIWRIGGQRGFESSIGRRDGGAQLLELLIGQLIKREEVFGLGHCFSSVVILTPAKSRALRRRAGLGPPSSLWRLLVVAVGQGPPYDWECEHSARISPRWERGRPARILPLPAATGRRDACAPSGESTCVGAPLSGTTTGTGRPVLIPTLPALRRPGNVGSQTQSPSTCSTERVGIGHQISSPAVAT